MRHDRREGGRHLRTVRTSSISGCGQLEERNVTIRRRTSLHSLTFCYRNRTDAHEARTVGKTVVHVSFCCLNPRRSITAPLRSDGEGSQRVGDGREPPPDPPADNAGDPKQFPLTIILVLVRDCIERVSKEAVFREVVALGEFLRSRPKRNSLKLDIPMCRECTNPRSQENCRFVAALAPDTSSFTCRFVPLWCARHWRFTAQ